MAYTITDPAVLRLVRDLAELTGEPMDQAVAAAVRERLARALQADRAMTTTNPQESGPVAARAAPAPAHLRTVAAIQRFVAGLPVLDDRPADELLYDEHGLPR